MTLFVPGQRVVKLYIDEKPTVVAAGDKSVDYASGALVLRLTCNKI